METLSDNEPDKETFFAPAEKASAKEFHHEIEIVSKNPVIDSIMDNVSGLLAVLNKHRQTLSVNNALLRTLGMKNAEETLGLRVGEVFRCIHCKEAPHGCGTTKYCSTCGAAIAIVTSSNSNKDDKRVCVMTTERNSKAIDLYLQVQASPIVIDNEQFILLFIQDVTDDQQRAALERVFFHDINNIIHGLLSSSYLMNQKADATTKKLAARINKLTIRLSKEVEIQEVSTNHPAATGKYLRISDLPDINLNTDSSLLTRILTNMLVNAFEATSDGSEVKLDFKQTEKDVTFCVWNQENIPEDIALRIFQRNYSTKNENGRGLGTYVMKLFGEKYLGGKVDFSTSASDGTTFSFSLPMPSHQ